MKKIQLIPLLLCICASTIAQNIKSLTPVSFTEMNEQKAAEWQRAYEKLAKSNWDDAVLTEKEKQFGIWEGSISYWSTTDEGDGWYNAGGPDTVIASSSLKNQGKYTYDATNAHDYSLKTIWSEGVKGYGIGEYLLYKFREGAPRITTIYIANGCVQSKSLYQANSRVKKLKVYFDGKPIAILNLKDIQGVQTFDLGTLGYDPASEKAWTLKFEIMEVYPGTKYDDTVISEIYFSGIDVL